MLSPSQLPPNLALTELESLHARAETEETNDLAEEGISPSLPVRPRGSWSRRRMLLVAIGAVAVAIAVLVAVVVSSAPPIPTAIPIPAGTVFPLLPYRASNGTLMVYTRSFNVSGTAPPGMCLNLVGAWTSTAPTIAAGAWPPDYMNGTVNLISTSPVGASTTIGFISHQPDTITVTQTIQFVDVSCPPPL